MLKNIESKLKSQKGFSLVELIVVIAIMVILVAMLLPSVAGLISNAQQANGAQAASSLYTAASTATAQAAALDADSREEFLKGDSGIKANIKLDDYSGDKVAIIPSADNSATICVVYNDGDNCYVNPTKYVPASVTDEAERSKGLCKGATSASTVAAEVLSELTDADNAASEVLTLGD